MFQDDPVGTVGGIFYDLVPSNPFSLNDEFYKLLQGRSLQPFPFYTHLSNVQTRLKTFQRRTHVHSFPPTLYHDE